MYCTMEAKRSLAGETALDSDILGNGLWVAFDETTINSFRGVHFEVEKACLEMEAKPRLASG